MILRGIAGAAVNSFVGGVVSGTRGFVNIARSLASGVISTVNRHRFVSSALSLVLIGGFLLKGVDVARFDDAQSTCNIDGLNTALASVSANDFPGVSSDMTERARQVWSVLRHQDFDDVNIAGILGNWQVESSITHARIEGDLAGAQEVLKDPDFYVLHRLFPAYAREGISINRDAYRGSDGKYYPGLGWGQWTGPRGEKFLKWLESNNLNFTDIEAHVAYLLSVDSASETLNDYRDTNFSSPLDAAYQFYVTWEMPGDFQDSSGTTSMRQKNAEYWFSQMEQWSLGNNLFSRVKSLIGLSGTQNNARVTAVKANVREKFGCVDRQTECSASSEWTGPVVGHLESSYGARLDPITQRASFHDGADISAPANTPIYAANSGVVARVDFDPGGAGNYVLIDHGGGVFTAYLHQINGGIVVKKGQKVSSGEIIGHVGTTGYSTGNHLHFEVRENTDVGSYWNSPSTNPVDFMKQRGVELGKLGGSNAASTHTSVSNDCVSSMDVSGSEVVKYAKQFLGTPYVWGGTSAITGWDCSGYVQFVFKHFGYVLPHQSEAIRDQLLDKEVTYSQARPGDLVWYPGHVALYIGNGRIYGAQNADVGTIELNYDYRDGARFFRVIDESVAASGSQPNTDNNHD